MASHAEKGAIAKSSNPWTISVTVSQSGIHPAMPPLLRAQAITAANNRRTGVCLTRSLALPARTGPIVSRNVMTPPSYPTLRLEDEQDVNP